MSEAIFSPDDWRRILWSCELFLIGAEQLYKYFLHAYARPQYPNLKVILLGQGSDEFTGGYIERALGGHGPWRREHWSALAARLRGQKARLAVLDADIGVAHLDLLQRGVLDPEFTLRSADGCPGRGTWSTYVQFYLKNLDYHLWHEDRTASAHSIENRVPFLDHRLIELSAEVPLRRHAELFVNKRILRGAVSDLVPETIRERPKGYFFYGRDQRFAFRMMHSILTANNYELIEQAIAGSASTNGPLNPDGFRAYCVAVGKNPATMIYRAC